MCSLVLCVVDFHMQLCISGSHQNVTVKITVPLQSRYIYVHHPFYNTMLY